MVRKIPSASNNYTYYGVTRPSLMTWISAIFMVVLLSLRRRATIVRYLVIARSGITGV